MDTRLLLIFFRCTQCLVTSSSWSGWQPCLLLPNMKKCMLQRLLTLCTSQTMHTRKKTSGKWKPWSSEHWTLAWENLCVYTSSDATQKLEGWEYYLFFFFYFNFEMSIEVNHFSEKWFLNFQVKIHLKIPTRLMPASTRWPSIWWNWQSSSTIWCNITPQK